MGTRELLVAGLAATASLSASGVALGHDVHLPVRAAQDVSEPCPGDSIDDGDADAGPDRVMTGRLGDEVEGGYVFLPFRVPAGTTAVRVKYCYEQTGSKPEDRSTLDLGLYEPRDSRAAPWGPREFRGWGGSSHPDVIVSPHGFTSERRYLRDPEQQVPGRTTRAFLPGPIPSGRWAAELGVAAVASSGNVPYRVEIELTEEEFPFRRYRSTAYDRSPASTDRRWYAGDFHVHGEHSALGDAPMSEVFDYAFGSLAAGKAGLDFITLSDYVSGSSWGEVGRFQDAYPDNLIIRSAEVITYRGHANSHANTRVMDYRHGPLYRRAAGGGIERLRGPRPASDTFDRVHGAGGFTQINHPTIFPSPPFPENLCRGCPWEYSDAQTDYSKVDAIEVATGPAGLDEAPGEPGPNPFTVTGIEFWEDALAAGHKIAAVGSSDSHNAGRTPDPITQAPIGTATTVVRADELSEDGIERGVRAGHTYVKVYGNDGPDLRLRAVREGRSRAIRAAREPAGAPRRGGRRAIMGDTLRARRAEFTARVLGGAPGSIESRPDPLELLVLKDGRPYRAAPVTSDDFTLRFAGASPGRYRLQVQRGTAIEALSSPIYLEARRRAGSDARGGDPERDRRDDSPAGGDESGPAGGDESGSAGGSGRGEPGASVRPDTASGAVSSVPDDDRSSAGRLPFTGLALLAVALLGAALLGGGAGLLLRIRRTT